VCFAGAESEVAVRERGRVNAATAWQLVHEAGLHPDTPLLLIAEEATAQARAILSEHGVAVVDRLGNAHIELPGLLLHVEGGKRRARRAPPVRLNGKAGVVAQALLLDPEREWRIKDLVERTDVSAGLAHRVLARLDREGVTAVEGAGPQRVRRVTTPTALLDLWVEEDDPRPARLSGHVLARTPSQLVEKLAGNLADSGIDYALTGAGAASILAPFITAVPVLAVWVTTNVLPDELFAAAGAEPVDEGQNIVFLQAKDNAPLAFAEQRENVRLANRLRVYADLLDDPRRGEEQAKHLRSEVIGF
jgi:Transcriptional regulator, AbiEi antitoxin, Type IV TA system